MVVQVLKTEIGETIMALEKKPLVSKKASTSSASKNKPNVKAKVDTAKPTATKVATAFKVFP
jgi:hypothetical protein